jgi:hypothetical protein
VDKSNSPFDPLIETSPLAVLQLNSPLQSSTVISPDAVLVSRFDCKPDMNKSPDAAEN